LVLDGSVITGNLDLHEAECSGAVRMNAIDVKSDLDLTGIKITGGRVQNLFPKQPDNIPVAITLHRSAIAGRLFLLQLTLVRGQVRLLYAHCAALIDDNSLPDRYDLLLDGFTYDRLYDGPVPISVQARIGWLAKSMSAPGASSRFHPQPASQLVKVLTEMGFEEDAKKVAIQREIWRRERGNWHLFARLFHKLYGILTGYGYRPDWVIIYMAVDLVLASGIYYLAQTANGIIPVEGKKQPASFSAVLYSIDNGLPFLNFGLSKEWRPNFVDQMDSTVQRPAPGRILCIHAGWLARITIIVQTIFGWIGSIALLAFLNSLARRDR
jgi:hypothetical protein